MTPPEPGAPGRLIPLPLHWHEQAWKERPMSWSRKQADAGRSGSDDGDTRTTRSDQPQWQHPEDEAAAP